LIVLDASSAVELLAGSRLGKAVVERTRPRAESLHAPHLLDLEVAQTFRRCVAAGILSSARAREALDDFALLDIERYPHAQLLPRIWQLRENLTAYDAAYVVLAEALGCPLLTCDRRLAQAPGIRARVELVSL
jgi:predicted nucleic acid-binding protein